MTTILNVKEATAREPPQRISMLLTAATVVEMLGVFSDSEVLSLG